MTTTGPAPRSLANRLARAVTEVFAPAVLAGLMPVVIALRFAPSPLAGLGWGLLAALFSAGIPYGIVWLGVRRGRLTDHHIGVREQRVRPSILALGSLLAGLAVLIGAGAPRQLVAMAVAMLAVLLVVAAVNHGWKPSGHKGWKLSGHAAVAAGSAAVLIIVFGRPLAVAPLVVALIAWSRVELRDHTIGQVVAGAAAGALVAAATYLPLA